MRWTRRLPRTLYPADFTNFLTLEATLSKNFWFLNFTFPSPIIEFTWYIRFWRFCGFPNIAMRELLLFSQRTLQLKQGNSVIKKITKNITDQRCRIHQPAMPPNFKKNGSLLHEIRMFEVSMPRYPKTRFVKFGTFCYIGSQISNIIPEIFDKYPWKISRNISEKIGEFQEIIRKLLKIISENFENQVILKYLRNYFGKFQEIFREVGELLLQFSELFLKNSKKKFWKISRNIG